MTSEIKDIFSNQAFKHSEIQLDENQKKEFFKKEQTKGINQDYPDRHELGIKLEEVWPNHELELKKEEVRAKKIDNQSKEIDIGSKKVDIFSKGYDIILRIFFAFWVLFIVTSFLNYVKEILSLKFNYEKNLSDKVIIALLTTTTINILTLFYGDKLSIPKKI
jgi:hypothetical protein